MSKEFVPSKKVGCESAGGFNDMPKPAVICDLKEFFAFYGSYSPDKIEFRQALIDGVYRDIKIFWFWNRAYALQFVPEDLPICWRIGCNHKFVELSQAECREAGIQHCGSCWHVVKCKKCGSINSYDSSG